MKRWMLGLLLPLPLSLVLLGSACSLNPQPLPPGDQPDAYVPNGNTGSGGGSGSGSSGGSSSGGLTAADAGAATDATLSGGDSGLNNPGDGGQPVVDGEASDGSPPGDAAPDAATTD